MRLFGTSGIRRLANKELTQLALQVGLALGQRYRRVVIGCDTRTSSPAIKHAVLAGLLTSGAESCDAGLTPTPTLALAGRKFDAGVMITASHNPPEYNGIKLWNPDGAAFELEQESQIEKMIRNNTISGAPWPDIKTATAYTAAVSEHIERIAADFPAKLSLKVVLDCGCGAASVITPGVLRRLGCEITSINCSPSGFFPRNAEPTPENLGELIKVTRMCGADVGIAHDGDADRMMAIDDKGRFIPGDKLLIILANSLGAQELVTTLDASMAIEETGLKVRRTRIGDPYVSRELKRNGDFGGEPSGSWIFPEVSLCPDGIYAAATLAAIASEKRLSSLADAIPAYPIIRGSVPGDSATMASLEHGLRKMKPKEINSTDGLKLEFDDGWLLVRPSGTEPKIRITAEARSQARLEELYNCCLEVIRNSPKGGG